MKGAPGVPRHQSLAKKRAAQQRRVINAYGAGLNQARTLLAERRFDEAIHLLNKLMVSREPQSLLLFHQAWRGKAEELFQARRYAQASDLLRELVSERPDDDVESWWLLGAALFQRRSYAEAARAFRQVVALTPDDAETYVDLARALQHAGDLDGSVKALRRAVALRPDERDWRAHLERVERARRRAP